MTAIQIHLTLEGYKTSTGQTIESCLTKALREARHITGRNKSTGLPDPENTFGDLGNWSGAMCYMTILDQIGKCYRPKSKTKCTRGSPIVIALTYFSSLSSDEISAIYALRCAFFHDFSLYNKHDNPKLQHTFAVENHPTNPVVILPKSNWDGKMSSRTSDNNTHVNLRKFGDLVEEIYENLISLETKTELILELPGGDE
jgi:hypothetical protein